VQSADPYSEQAEAEVRVKAADVPGSAGHSATAEWLDEHCQETNITSGKRSGIPNSFHAPF